MFKNKAVLEVKSPSDRMYVLTCDLNSPLGECYDALQEMLQHVTKQINDAASKEEAPNESSECGSEECCQSSCEE